MNSQAFLAKSGMSLDDLGFKLAFVGGTMVIDCPEIKLIQKGAASPRVYTAPGFIEAGAQSGIQIRLVCPRPLSEPYDPFGFFKQDQGYTAGVVLPSDHYFQLEARDIAGNVWTCPSGSLSRVDEEQCLVLMFSATHLRMEEPSRTQRSYAHLVFLDDLEFPKNSVQTVIVERAGKIQSRETNRHGSAGVLAGMKVSYTPKNNNPDAKYAALTALADDGMSPPLGFEDRLIEAIRFCTASLATPVMTEVNLEGVKVIELSIARPTNRGLVQPPISQHHGHDSDFYKLFECYYNYACENASGRDYAPLSARLGGCTH
jgi:hypothetical protein